MPTVCDSHKEDGMTEHTNIKSGKAKATHCASHGRELGMRDVRNKRCEGMGELGPCTVVLPLFGWKGDVPRFCAKHKKDGMVNLLSPRCVKCEEQGVIKCPCYGNEGGRGTHCASCARVLNEQRAEAGEPLW